MRLRGLYKLPDGRDWWWEKLGLALVGRAMLTKIVIKLSAGEWGCVSWLAWGNPTLRSTRSTVELMVNSKRAYTNGHLPRLLLPLSLSLPWATAKPCLHRRPSNINRSGSVSCGVIVPFLWVLMGEELREKNIILAKEKMLNHHNWSGKTWKFSESSGVNKWPLWILFSETLNPGALPPAPSIFKICLM